MKTLVFQDNLEYLLSELRRVTTLVAARVQEMQAESQAEAEAEFLGLYVTEEEVQQILGDPYLFLVTDQPAALPPAQRMGAASFSRLRRLQHAFNLTSFELDVLLLALAPELDLRYEKLFVFLQDDISRRRPSVDLALRLLCPGLAGQVAVRHCFDADAPLIKNRLIELSEESQNRQTSLLARFIKLDEGIVAYLLGENKLDVRLRLLTELVTPEVQHNFLGEANKFVQRLTELAINRFETDSVGFVSVLVGPDESSKQAIVTEVCRRLELSLIVLDTAQLVNSNKINSYLSLLEREVRLRDATLYWKSYEVLLKEEIATQEARRLVARYLKEQTGLDFISSTHSLAPSHAGPKRREYVLNLESMSYSARESFWKLQLGAEAVGLDLQGLSSRFKLNRGQIEAAVASGRNAALWRGETAPTLSDLEEACRVHSNQRLNNLARKIIPHYQWQDIVLPPDQFNMLHEICEQVKNRALVYEAWGFERKISLGKGLNVIFAGPSGTGKTMSAELIAGELKMDLYKIDLSNMVSKYIGETEKNLERIFQEAGESNAILFFDEADSLFGKRSEVKDAHDRYANIETGYLLQKMEEYEGIVILATNLRKNLDDAFVRRMHFILEYPFPDEKERLEIWRRVFPATIKLSPNVDLGFLARQFKISGGNIKNIALAAAFLAASSNQQPTGEPYIGMTQLIRATRRELQKMGKLCTEADFGPYFSVAIS